MAVAGSLSANLTANTTDFERAMKRSADSMKGLQAQGQAVQQFLGNFDRSLKNLTLGFVSFAAAKAAFQGVVQAGTDMQRLDATFKLLAGSADGARQQIEFVRKTADQLGQSFVPLADSYKRLSAATRQTNLEGQQTQDIFRGTVRSMTALGASQDEINGVFLAFQQIISRGNVTAEDFNQITERIPGALNLASRALGVTTQEFAKMREQGELIATQFVPKFVRQMETELGGGADAMSRTFGAAMARLGNSMQDLGNSVAQTGVLDWLGSIATRLSDIIKQGPEAKRALEDVGKAKTRQDVAPLGREGLSLTSPDQGRIDAINAAIARERQGIAYKESSFFGRNEAILQHQRRIRELETEKTQLLEGGGRGRATDRESAIGALDIAGGSTTNAQLQDLRRTVQERADTAARSIGLLDERKALATGEGRAAIVTEQLKELDKAIQDIEATLGRSKNIAPLLGVGATPSLPGVKTQNFQQYMPMIQSMAGQYGLDPSLVAAMVAQESGFNPKAQSRAGAIGLMQLMPGTAAQMGVKDPWDPQQNLAGGMQYMSQQLAAQRGNLPLALAAYNAGPGAVQKYGGIPPYAETQGYVMAVQRNMGLMQGAAAGGGVPALDALRQRRNTLLAGPGRLELTPEDIEAEGEAFHNLGRIIADVDIQRRKLFSNEGLETTPQERIAEAEAEARAIEEGAEAQLKAAKERFQGGRPSKEVFRQAAMEEAQSIFQITEALTNERDQLTLTNDALLEQALRRQHASEETIAYAKQLQAGNKILRDSAHVADFVSDAFIELASTGRISFSSLLQDFSRMITRMLFEASGLRQGLTNLFAQGAQGVLAALGGVSANAAGATAASGISTTALTATGSSAAGLAEGGYAMPGSFHLVGENGPEVLQMGSQGGYVHPNGALGGNNTVNMYITTPDAGSFRRSQGEIESSGRRMLANIQRSAA